LLAQSTLPELPANGIVDAVLDAIDVFVAGYFGLGEVVFCISG